MKQRILAFDLGTSGVKAVLLDMAGEVLRVATESYPLYNPSQGYAEQDPEDYWRGVCTACRRVMASADVAPHEIAGIAFGTQWKGMIPVDSAGKLLHRSIIWLDSRASEEAALLNEHFGKPIFGPTDYWAKLFWLRRHHPEVIERAAVILEPNAYLKWRATGVAASDISNCFTRSPDAELDTLYSEVLAFADIPREKLPPLVKPTDLVGHVTERAAAEMGVAAGVPVFGGNNDIFGIAVGSGCAKEGCAHVYFGSSGWIGYTVPHSSKELYFCPFDEQRDVAIFALQAIGLAFNHAVRMLYASEMSSLGDRVFAFVDGEVDRVPAGSCGVFATPWFFGEREPLYGADARGSFLGLSSVHGREHMVRAVMEGICYQLRMGAEYQSTQHGRRLGKEICVVGGGAVSGIWMQMLADVLNVTVRVPTSPRHAGAVGTAYSALIGLSVCTDYEDAAKRVRTERIFTPRRENVAVYENGYAIFRRLYRALSDALRAM
ncbi:MAG: carbohydrate kinase [Ruminococcaceae bacterium]|nr:carbohydrate kinase [Oscillospiraceae bacterium]